MEDNKRKLGSGVADDATPTTEIKETADSTAEQSQDNADSKGLPPNVEQFRGRAWLSYVITASILAVITVLVGWARGGFTNTDVKVLIGNWSDAFSVPGMLCLGVGLLTLGSNGGAFDMLAYGVRRLFGLFKKDPLDRKYGTFYEYSHARRERKRSFWYLVIVGGAYLAVGITLLVIYMQT